MYKRTNTIQNGGWKGSGILSLFIIGIVFFLIMPVAAQNMSITTFDLLNRQDVAIYVANGTLLGTYNTSSQGIALPPEDFQLVVRPTGLDRFSNPETMLEDAWVFFENHWVALIVIGVIVGIATKRL